MAKNVTLSSHWFDFVSLYLDITWEHKTLSSARFFYLTSVVGLILTKETCLKQKTKPHGREIKKRVKSHYRSTLLKHSFHLFSFHTHTLKNVIPTNTEKSAERVDSLCVTHLLKERNSFFRAARLMSTGWMQ